MIDSIELALKFINGLMTDEDATNSLRYLPFARKKICYLDAENIRHALRKLKQVLAEDITVLCSQRLLRRRESII